MSEQVPAQTLSPADEQRMFEQFAGLPLPQIMFNGNVNRMTASEISSIVMFGNRPVAQITMTPVVAKMFASELLGLVERYERAAGQKVPDFTELQAKLSVP